MALKESESEYFSPYRADGKLFGFVCVVTGADGPIGQAIVAELAAHGAACVYACSPSQTDTPSTSTAPQEDATQYPNTKIIPYPYTITSESETLALIDEALNAWGRLDIWVTASSLLGPQSITSTTPADLYKCFEANSLAPFFALKYAPAAMAKTTPKGNYPNAAPKDQKYGSIIVVTSAASTYGGCWGPCYTMTSHAALGVVRSGVSVLKGSGIRINAISPGTIDVGVSLEPNQSHMSDHLSATVGLERAGSPVEIARVAGFLASGFSAYMTGANLVVDGGATQMGPSMVPI